MRELRSEVCTLITEINVLCAQCAHTTLVPVCPNVFHIFPITGVRLGKLMAKVGIVKLLSKYRFDAVSKAELEFENYGITLHVKGGIPMRISRR